MWYTEAVDYCAEVYAVVQKHKLCPAVLVVGRIYADLKIIILANKNGGEYMIIIGNGRDIVKCCGLKFEMEAIFSKN